MILGFMIFFPIVVAPSVFKNFNEKQSQINKVNQLNVKS